MTSWSNWKDTHGADKRAWISPEGKLILLGESHVSWLINNDDMKDAPELIKKEIKSLGKDESLMKENVPIKHYAIKEKGYVRIKHKGNEGLTIQLDKRFWNTQKDNIKDFIYKGIEAGSLYNIRINLFKSYAENYEPKTMSDDKFDIINFDNFDEGDEDKSPSYSDGKTEEGKKAAITERKRVVKKYLLDKIK